MDEEVPVQVSGLHELHDPAATPHVDAVRDSRQTLELGFSKQAVNPATQVPAKGHVDSRHQTRFAVADELGAYDEPFDTCDIGIFFVPQISVPLTQSYHYGHW